MGGIPYFVKYSVQKTDNKNNVSLYWASCKSCWFE